VGAGPAGFYAAEALKLADQTLEVHLYDRYPMPFGLTRFGIAPDHQRLKAPAQLFQRTGAMPGVRFFGGVEIGRDVSLDVLRSTYSAVLLAHGAQADERLILNGATPAEVRTAREMVAWYNGVPDVPADDFNLQRPHVVVIGNGNVAIDIALLELRKSQVRQVHLIGRRGPVQARFTTRELRELGELPGVEVRVEPQYLELGAACQTELDHHSGEQARRNMDLMRDWVVRQSHLDSQRELHLHFGLVPEAMERDADGHGQLLLRRMRLVGEPFAQRSEPTDERIRLRCDLLISSIGFRVASIPGLDLPCTPGLPHAEGRVLDTRGLPIPGLYVAGWAKRGPSGVLGTNRACAQDTVQSVLADRNHWPLPESGALTSLLDSLFASDTPPVAWEDWLHLDHLETEIGRADGRPRIKFDDMRTLNDVLCKYRSAKPLAASSE
jgi:ferredoxin--NADP+ reductase